MADMMMFPKTVDEFMEKYKIVDSDEVYTNGAELVPIFRMKQWFEHVDIEPVRHGHWEEKKVEYDDKAEMIQEWQSAKCSVCGLYDARPHLYYPIWSNYCPHCGSKMDVPDTNVGKMEDENGID